MRLMSGVVAQKMPPPTNNPDNPEGPPYKRMSTNSVQLSSNSTIAVAAAHAWVVTAGEWPKCPQSDVFWSEWNRCNCCLCVFKCCLRSLLLQPTGWPVPASEKKMMMMMMIERVSNQTLNSRDMSRKKERKSRVADDMGTHVTHLATLRCGGGWSTGGTAANQKRPPQSSWPWASAHAIESATNDWYSVTYSPYVTEQEHTAWQQRVMGCSFE